MQISSLVTACIGQPLLTFWSHTEQSWMVALVVAALMIGSVYFTGDILAATDRLELIVLAVKNSLSWHDAIHYQQKGHLSGKRHHPVHGVMVMCNACYANDGFQFDSHLADFRYVFFSAFFQLRLGVTFIGVSVVRLGLA